MTKLMSYTFVFKLKAIELAEATSNRYARKELGINEKLVRDWRKKKTELVKQHSDLEEVRWPELEVLRHPNNATYTPLKIEIKISPQKYRVRLLLRQIR